MPVARGVPQGLDHVAFACGIDAWCAVRRDMIMTDLARQDTVARHDA
jgi:hypothetical protein